MEARLNQRTLRHRAHGREASRWRSDGSRLYGYELALRLYRPYAGPFTTDLARLDFGFTGVRLAFDALVSGVCRGA
jgi:hypothetical protein